jgi:predicted CxxxxCH...CXXCH cytochrome family protein
MKSKQMLMDTIDMKLARRSAKIGLLASLLVVMTLLVDALPAVAADSPMLHNSYRFPATIKHGGAWGLPGTKYGEFQCGTCHARSTGNIKRVKATITTPDGSNWEGPGSPNVTVNFQATSGVDSFGDDGRASLTSSEMVCEACHSQNKFHNYNTANNLANGGDFSHENQKDCMTCHLHSRGFGANCDACHGNPPITADTDGSTTTGLVHEPSPTGATNPANSGAHELHVMTEGMGCVTCHKGNTMPTVSNTIQMGFEVNNSSWTGFLDTVTNGNLDAPDEGAGQMSASYSFVSSSAGTTITKVANNNLTCTVYCHGDWPGNGGQTATSWLGGTAMSDDCSDCHGGSAATPLTTGSHRTHAGNGAGELALACDKCHPTYIDTAHLDGDVAWELDTGDSMIGASATYSGAPSGTTGGKAPSAAYGNCSSTYCHGPGIPTWGGMVNCGDCHAVNNVLPSSHPTHYGQAAQGDTFLATKVTGDSATYVYQCGSCHSDAPHANGSKDVVVEANWDTNGATANWNSGTSTCVGTYCHSDGVGGAGNVDPVWATTTMSCGSCHDAEPATGDHVGHVADATYNISCAECHNVTTTDDATINNKDQHVDGAADVDISATHDGNGATSNWNGTSCAAVYCHSDGKATPTYVTVAAGAGPTSCSFCHGGAGGSNGGAGNALSASHTVHTGTNGTTQFSYTCDDCHAQTASDNTMINSFGNHVNKTRDVAVAAANGGTGTNGGDYNGTGCATTNCHGSNSAGAGDSWAAGGTTGDCAFCHGMAASVTDGRDTNGNTAATDAQVGAHVVHLNNAVYDIGSVSCDDCHVDPNSSAGTYVQKVNTAGHMNGTTGLIWSALAKTGGLTPSYVGGSCSNVYCHNPAASSVLNAANAGATTSPSWTAGWDNAGKDAATCGVCHDAPPGTSSYDHSSLTIASDCSGCHGHNGRGGTHLDGTLDASGDCTSCHGGATPAAGVSVNSSHVYLTRAAAATGPSAAAACEACHPGGTVGLMHVKNGDTSVVLIPNNTAVGISYLNGTNGYTGDNGIVLGGDNTVGTTEAEICWNCHDLAANNVSEWGTNTQANTGNSTYDYGNLGGASNWIGATWTSGVSAFAYKTSTIQSVHTANSSDTNGYHMTGTSVAEIRCSFCHDVHDTYAATSTAQESGAPYLRGSWRGNPYLEDGAPQPNTTWTTNGNFGNVPRGGTAASEYGGFQIDQNNGNPNTWTATEFGGLCDLCHGGGGASNNGTLTGGEIAALNQYGSGTASWVSGLNGHANVVKGGNTGTQIARDIFNADRRLPGQINTSLAFSAHGEFAHLPVMAYMHAVGYRGHGIRGLDGDSYGNDGGGGYNPVPDAGDRKYAFNSYDWGANVDLNAGDGNQTPQTSYHQFTCSKCHNPHASRLPKLMITNCLDTKHNTWDNASGITTSPPNGTVNKNGNQAHPSNEDKTWSNTSSAQNCHRLRDPRTPNSSGTATTGDGWNNVTPWDIGGAGQLVPGNYPGTPAQDNANSLNGTW